MNEPLIALIAVVLVMGLVGYILSKLAEPSTKPATSASANNTRSSRHSSSEPGSNSNSNDATAQEEQTRVANSLKDAQLIEDVNRRLPQTQCAQCGYPGCRPYATAIINEGVPVNQCPPGGEALVAELADFLGVEAIPLDSEKGQTKPAQVALIVEPDCIGCTLCIAACPVDAIVGAQKYMHTVITSQCTGCELCLPPCPVDCIELQPVPVPLHRWQWPKPA